MLVTGGLGPTKDDITLKTLCDYFDTSLYFSEEVHTHIENMFHKRGYAMNELTRAQAYVPEKATVILNHNGTAPCTWFEQHDAILVSMPGVPFEMKSLMESEVVPRLKEKFHRDIFIKHQTISVTGIAEAALAIKLTTFEENLPSFVKLAYLPQSGIIRLRLSTYCEDEKIAEETIATLQQHLKELLDKYIIADLDKNIEALIGEKLRTKGLTVGTAESCTGGAIAALLTSVPGSSDYYRGSIVAYSNEVKHSLLGVSKRSLAQFGAVSKEVVEQMATGALRALGCDYTIATTGIAGPNGGTPEKRVGTIWIAVSNNKMVTSQKFHFTAIREQNIQRTVNTALIMLLNNM